MPAREPGKFIVFEGIDGSGTTTQAKLLAEWLGSRGRNVYLTCEPSRGSIGQSIRKLLASDEQKSRPDERMMALLFAADRLEHLQKEITPRLAQGIDVISDRYVASSLAYQSLSLDLSWVDNINQFATPCDLLLYLRTDEQVAASRRQERGAAAEIYEKNDIQKKVISAYERVFAGHKAEKFWKRIEVLNGNKAIEQVQVSIRETVQASLSM